MNARRITLKSMTILAIGLCAALASGCGSQTVPTGASGVLSTIHQKTLALATERALAKPDLEAMNLSGSKVRLQFNVADASPDLAKIHVKNVVTERFRTASAGIAGPEDADARSIQCKIVLAGVDVNEGSFLFWRWIDTKAEVQLQIKDGGPTAAAETPGSGTSQYSQAWFLSFRTKQELK